MKLLYTLPEREERALSPFLSKGEVLSVALPFDLWEGRMANGFFAVTDKAVYRLLDGEVDRAYPLFAFSAFRMEEYLNSATLIGISDGEEIALCSYIKSGNERRYAALLRRLSFLLAGEAEEDDGDEEVCKKCGQPYGKEGKYCRFCADGGGKYRCLWESTKGLRFLLFVPLLFMVVSLVIRFVTPIIQKEAINGYIYPGDGVIRGEREQFFVLVLSLVLLELISRLLSLLQSYLSGVSGTRYSVRLRRLMFEKVESLSLSSIGRHSIGHLSQRINGDVQTVGRFIVNRLPRLLSQLMGLVVGTVLILSISPTMSLLVFSPLPVVVAFLLVGRKYLQRWTRRLHFSSRRYYTSLFDYIWGARVVKAYGKEKSVKRVYHEKLDTLIDLEDKRYRRAHLVSLIGGQLYEIGSYLLLFFGNLWLFWGQVDVGTISQFTAYSALFYEPLKELTDLPDEITAFTTSLGQLTEILDEEPEIRDSDHPVSPPIKGNIEVKNLSFGYTRDVGVLKDVSLSIKAGEMIGIVGHSGCGKTTLVNLIMRLYEAERGEILIDGVDIKDMPQKHLRTNIGVVPQETQLFDGTVRENILYSKPTATLREVIEAARVAGAHDFIMSLPEGYNTRVGDRGYSLSGGERQRVAIARALLHDPKILILDEATAALDTETEKKIQDALDRLTEGRTTLAIAHRLSTLRNADRLIVFEGGQVKEVGTHKELLEKRGIYYDLVSAQAEAALGNDALLSGEEIVV